MKLCRYDEGQAGIVHDGKVYPIGETLVAAGHIQAGYTMPQLIDALANRPEIADLLRQHGAVPTQPAVADDEALIVACRNGDRAAIQEHIRRHPAQDDSEVSDRFLTLLR